MGDRSEDVRQAFRGKNMSDKVYALIAEDPDLTSVEIAEILGTSSPYVRVVAQRRGVKLGSRTNRVRDIGRISPENMAWVRGEARTLGVTVEAALNAIITDARLDSTDSLRALAAEQEGRDDA